MKQGTGTKEMNCSERWRGEQLRLRQQFIAGTYKRIITAGNGVVSRSNRCVSQKDSIITFVQLADDKRDTISSP